MRLERNPKISSHQCAEDWTEYISMCNGITDLIDVMEERGVGTFDASTTLNVASFFETSGDAQNLETAETYRPVMDLRRANKVYLDRISALDKLISSL